jgi:hypothetical protein
MLDLVQRQSRAGVTAAQVAITLLEGVYLSMKARAHLGHLCLKTARRIEQTEFRHVQSRTVRYGVDEGEKKNEETQVICSKDKLTHGETRIISST